MPCQSPRGRNHDVWLSGELLELLKPWESPHYHTSGEVDAGPERLELLINLKCQFSSRGQHKTENTIWILYQEKSEMNMGFDFNLCELGEDWKGERGSFTTSCLGIANHILTTQDAGNALCLDWGWLFESHLHTRVREP